MNGFRASKSKKKSESLKKPEMTSLAEYAGSPSSSARSWKETFGEMLVASDFKKPRSDLKTSSGKVSEKRKSKKDSILADKESTENVSSAQKVDDGGEQSCQPSAGSVSL